MDTNILTKKEAQAFRFVRNMLLKEGHPPSVREVSAHLGFRSPRSGHLLIGALVAKGWLKRRENGRLQLQRDLPSDKVNARTVDIPLVGCVHCGSAILAEENIEALIQISENFVPPGAKYFLLRAHGDSMNKAGIQDGNLLLIRQQHSAQNGENIVALINDDATVKQFHRETNAVVLKPSSSNPKHHAIILNEDFLIQGIVVKVLPANIN